MTNQLTTAVAKAIEHINLITGNDPAEDLRKKFSAMSKKDLVELLVEINTPKKATYTVEDIAYAILGDPDCAWLSWETIALVIQKYVPGTSTSVKSLQWYGSKGIEKERVVVPRKKAKEIAALLTSSM